MPLGGPPFFFVNGLLGGLGLNRDLILPSIDEVNEHLLIESLGGFSDPMAALANIKPQFPVKYGSFWFALGLKFKTVEIIETRAVLFARFGDDFTIGLLGLSTMDLPKRPCELPLNWQSWRTTIVARIFVYSPVDG